MFVKQCNSFFNLLILNSVLAQNDSKYRDWASSKFGNNSYCNNRYLFEMVLTERQFFNLPKQAVKKTTK